MKVFGQGLEDVLEPQNDDVDDADILKAVQCFVWSNTLFLRIKSTAKMQEYILITDVSVNTYSIFRAKRTLNSFSNLR